MLMKICLGNLEAQLKYKFFHFSQQTCITLLTNIARII
jgi:hypothetical protein